MANVYAVSAGVWSDPARWNTGSLPTSTDDVYSNGLAITIDQNVTVVSIRNTAATGIASGGNYTCNVGITINANIVANQTCVNVNSGTVVINGNSNGGSGHGISLGAATLNFTGNATGGTSSTGSGIIVGSGATLNMTGDAIGGTGVNTNAGVYINSASALSVTINGNVQGGSGGYGVYVPSAIPTITINGNITGGTTTNVYGMYITPAAVTVNVNGTITGGGGTAAAGVRVLVISTLNLTGNVIGGPTTDATGILNSGGGTVNITGTSTGGTVASAYGTHNVTTGTVIINTAIGGIGGSGARNESTGVMRVTTVKGSASAAAPGLAGISASGTTTWEKAEMGTLGASPISGYTKMKNVGVNTFIVLLDGSGTKTLVDTDEVTNGQPIQSDVRAGVVYDFGNKTGTCAVPLPSQVTAGVAIDNTVGTAVLTTAQVKAAILDADVSTLTVSNSIGERLKNCSTVETTGAQITSLNP